MNQPARLTLCVILGAVLASIPWAMLERAEAKTPELKQGPAPSLCATASRDAHAGGYHKGHLVGNNEGFCRSQGKFYDAQLEECSSSMTSSIMNVCAALDWRYDRALDECDKTKPWVFASTSK
jgi:hypothetical protein